MTKMFRAFVLGGALVATTASGQSQPEPQFFLVPLTVSEQPGANGSRWVVETFAQNRTDSLVWFSDAAQCWLSAVHACDDMLAPGEVKRLDLNYRSYHYYWVQGADPEAITFNSFVRNVGTDVDPWGTALPIARSGDFRAGPVKIRPVPNTGEHRLSVRVYSWPSAVPVLSIELWRLDPETLIPTELLSSKDVSAASNFEHYAGGVYETHDLFATVGAAVGEQFEIRIVPPPTPGLPRFWAFATITNNQTQHVTVFRP